MTYRWHELGGAPKTASVRGGEEDESRLLQKWEERQGRGKGRDDANEIISEYEGGDDRGGGEEEEAEAGRTEERTECMCNPP